MRNPAWLLVCLAAVAAVAFPAQANTYNVTGTADGAGTVTNLGNGVFSASTLRAAVNAANSAGGANTINLPAGTYDLTGGELQVGLTSNVSFTISGASAASTVIQHDTNSAAARVFDLDPNLLGGVSVNFQNLTIAHGRNADNTGGAGIISGFQGPPADTTSLINCVLLDNQVINGINGAVGGGIQNIGGSLSINGCSFLLNSDTNASGGAVYYDSYSPDSGTFQVTGSAFTTNVAGDLADGGGAIFVSGASGSSLSINNSSFVGNQVISGGGNGGAIIKFGAATLTISGSTFVGNRVLGTSSLANTSSGGAIDNAGGPMTVLFSRLFNNQAAVAGHGNAVNNNAADGATLGATNDWWGINTGPASADLVGATAPVWLRLGLTANPTTVVVGNSSALTASFLTNSAGSFVSSSSIGVLIGLPILFTNALRGVISSPQTTIQPSGTATATYTAQASGIDDIEAIVDNGVATVAITNPCVPINGSVSGGGTVCEGGSVVVAVNLSGGSPPYTVTLNNGGGTLSGASPLLFHVSPAGTTTYSASSAEDSGGCPAVVVGSAVVNIVPLPVPPITPLPATVTNLSTGNQASGPSGFAAYSWTIGNGVIEGSANAQTITYSAGLYGNVTLELTITNSVGCYQSNSISIPIVVEPAVSLGCDLKTNYFSSLTFTDAVPPTPTGIAFDGTNYWTCSGGTTSGIRLGKYDLNGVLLTNYAPGLDFRSVFTSKNGTLFASAYDSPIIYRQSAPGVFTTNTSLAGGSLNIQSSVILNGANTEYDAMSAGVISRWDLTGTNLASVTLQGYGALPGENVQPYDRCLAAAGEFWLTFASNGVVSVWDTGGVRLAETTLSGAGATAENTGWSFSYCNGKVFISPGNPGLWQAYDVCDQAHVAIFASPSTTSWISDVQEKILSAGSIPVVDTNLVNTGNPVPSLTNFRKYEAVFVFSDSSFNDPTNIGNALASYVDLGGGAAVATFAFEGGLGLAGRIGTNGYLPFTYGSQTQGTAENLVEVIPSHPLLDGVVSFSGGANSYHNTGITNTSGAVVAAQWTDSQPLVGGKEDPPGRAAGLNFYPPSSDVRSDFWVSTTDGARLMANALLWSGKIPPTITVAPATQAVQPGATATFQADAVGSPPLAYQWLLDGTNIAGATRNNLTVIAATNTTGSYRVLVSNPYGVSISPAGALNPALRFLSPVVSGRSLPLFLVNSDGSQITAAQAAKIELFTSRNPSLPFSEWSPAPNPLVLTGGMIRVDGIVLSNSFNFFRARQTP